jgi:ABC-2 type transport system ATP-binding protein
MNSTEIEVDGLSKLFRVSERESGFKEAVRSLFSPDFKQIEAVHSISFEVQAGEMIGLIGPNGAGKTTTLKMLSGLLYPTSGTAKVAGCVPWERKPDFLRQISMVLGNKSQLIWDIPAMDTFRVLAEIYGLSDATFRSNLDDLVQLLELEPLLTRPVRTLSLGERMKCELAAGLLYHPRILFLDEPTLGLDVSMQAQLRKYIGEYNQRHQATIILTSHYMADVTALCERVILIHHGQIQFDGNLKNLAIRLAPFKLIRLTLSELPVGGARELLAGMLSPQLELIQEEDHTITLRSARDVAHQFTGQILDRFPVIDLTVEDPPIEAVIDRIYQEGAL